MRDSLKILLAGRPSQPFSEMETLLADHRQLGVSISHLVNGRERGLGEPQGSHDVIVLVLDEEWRATLEHSLAGQDALTKPLLVVGPADDTQLMRQAMRLGARDFFPLPLQTDDFMPALEQLASEEHERRRAGSATLTTFMNAKGGSGASLCAANYAHMLVRRRERRTLLIDFELQFGSLCTYFNLHSRSGLMRALELADSLDTVALQAYTQRHENGVYMLGAAAEGLVLPESIHEDRIAKLFTVLDEAFEELVVDMPRRIDHATAAVLDRSDRIMLVTQQTIVHLQDLKRLVGLLTHELSIPRERIIVLVNRYQRRAEITLKDFQDALPERRVETLPNDYENVAKSINLGVPVLEHAPRSPYCKALLTLGETLAAPEEPPSEPARRGPLAWLPRGRS